MFDLQTDKDGVSHAETPPPDWLQEDERGKMCHDQKAGESASLPTPSTRNKTEQTNLQCSEFLDSSQEAVEDAIFLLPSQQHQTLHVVQNKPERWGRWKKTSNSRRLRRTFRNQMQNVLVEFIGRSEENLCNAQDAAEHTKCNDSHISKSPVQVGRKKSSDFSHSSCFSVDALCNNCPENDDSIPNKNDSTHHDLILRPTSSPFPRSSDCEKDSRVCKSAPHMAEMMNEKYDHSLLVLLSESHDTNLDSQRGWPSEDISCDRYY